MRLDISVLVIDDDADILIALKLLLANKVREIHTETNPDKIRELFLDTRYDIILLDMNFTKDTISGEEGFYYLKLIKEISPETIVIFLTAYGDVEKAVRALKDGATDFILKPWQNEKIIATINSASELIKAKKENKVLRESQNQYQEIIGNSEKMKQVFSIIDCVAPTDANILITGENGTGKELIAKAIHQKSAQKNNVFMSVDLGSIPETLFESELFGHTKGAFTDAKNARTGKFVAAENGTLFLDEIGNLGLQQQAKLLTVIEKKAVTIIGSNKTIPINVRLICATNCNLYDMIAENSFRQDLLYRINTVEIKLPPLRERKEDIPELVNHYLIIFKQKYKKNNLQLCDKALKFLKQYTWFGNIRELRHAIERSVILSQSNLLTEKNFSFLEDKKTIDIVDINSLEEIEKNLITDTISKHNGNISNTAKELGLTRSALYRRIKKHGI